MRLQQLLTTDINSAFLYLFILFADLDFSSILDYTIKAVIGGLVWLSFKLLSDHFSRKVKWFHKARQGKKEKEEKE